jgi:hypothetical protein
VRHTTINLPRRGSNIEVCTVIRAQPRITTCPFPGKIKWGYV